eukprot:m.111233 g.111233  ORF g.111233 m.111233 type:complete len:544 (+) comp10745_c0_seq1:527-2158(+)
MALVSNTQTLVLAIILLTAGLLGLIASSTVLHKAAVASQRQVLQGHLVVADAGSTHTDFSLYRWEAPCATCNETAVYGSIGLQLPFECDIKPGISSMTPAEVIVIVRSCLHQAAGNMTDEVVGKTPFMLRATAGMRLLNFENQSASDDVLQAVVDGSVGTMFINAGQPSTASILSGTDEGALSWATANYLKGTLTDALTAAHTGGMDAVRQLNTIGALDLGGASTQITFVPPTPPSNPEDQGQLHLYGESISVYTHSYLCYGQVQMTNRRLALLLNRSSNGNPVIDPCFPAGYVSDPMTEDMLNDLLANACITGFTTFDVATHVNNTRVGASDAVACNATIVELFDGTNAQDAALPVAQEGKFNDAVARQPTFPTFDLYAFSAYWYTANFLFPDLCKKDNACHPSLERFEAEAIALCDKNLTQIDDGKTKPQYLVEYCQNSMYIHALLDKYGMAPEDDNVFFVNQLRATDVGWAFGYSLNASASVSPASVVEKQEGISQHEQSGVKAGLTLSVIVAGAGVIMLAMHYRRRSRLALYSPISDYE